MASRNAIKRIAIIKLSALGDIIHTIPAIWLIKKKVPEIEITWFVEKGNEKLLECFGPFVNIEIISLRKRSLKYILTEIIRLRKSFKNRFDLIIDFQGLIKSAALSYILGKTRIGFHKNNLRESIASIFYNNSPQLFDESKHVIYKNTHLSIYILKKFFNIMNIKDKISYPILKTNYSKKIINFLRLNNIKENEFILINIGGGWETKTLSLKQYESLINRLKNEYRTLILWGNEKEKKIAKELSLKTGSIMTEFLTFDKLFMIISLAKIIITSDTLALHIADVVNTRSIGIFGPTSPDRNGSLNPLSSIVYKNIHCSPCHKKTCIDLKCIDRITIDDIIQSIRSNE